MSAFATAPASNPSPQSLREEWKTLKQEIMTYINLSHRIFFFNAAVVGAVIGVAPQFAEKTGKNAVPGIVFLAPFVFLFPSMLMLARNVREMRRLGAYIRLAIEPKLGLNWESDLFKLETKPDACEHVKGWYGHSFEWFYVLSTIGCLVAAFYWDYGLRDSLPRQDEVMLWLLSVVSLGLVAWVVTRYKVAKSPEQLMKIDQEWRSVLGMQP